MIFSKAEYEHLLDAEHARLARIGREGTAQIFPVNFIINLHTGAIDIVGPRLRASRLASTDRNPSCYTRIPVTAWADGSVQW